MPNEHLTYVLTAETEFGKHGERFNTKEEAENGRKAFMLKHPTFNPAKLQVITVVMLDGEFDPTEWMSLV